MDPRSLRSRKPHAGFSLIELVIVVVIIGIIGAVAVPRMSRGAQGASISALTGDLSVLNTAVEPYAPEHNGDYPDPAKINTQLVVKTNQWGDAWSGAPGEMAFGPYLRSVPPLPLGDRKGSTTIALNDGDDIGWLYVPASGLIRPNLNRDNGTTDEALVTSIINATAKVRYDLVRP